MSLASVAPHFDDLDEEAPDAVTHEPVARRGSALHQTFADLQVDDLKNDDLKDDDPLLRRSNRRRSSGMPLLRRASRRRSSAMLDALDDMTRRLSTKPAAACGARPALANLTRLFLQVALGAREAVVVHQAMEGASPEEDERDRQRRRVEQQEFGG